MTYDHRFPTVADLKNRAKHRIPKFAFDYLREGCMEDIALRRNRDKMKDITLSPQYLETFEKVDTSVDLFGHCYSAPFGIAPMGLQGLMWPNAPEILAKTAYKYNIPFVLSSVSSDTLEAIAQHSEGQAWYQLYNPTEVNIRDDILKRLKNTGYKVLMVTVDVPTFGFRPRDIRNGLSIPPKMSLLNLLHVMACPQWCMKTFYYGIPQFKNLLPYMSKGFKPQQLAEFMNTMAMGENGYGRT